jgi:ADP-heptose:LPS heptosyltransferase
MALRLTEALILTSYHQSALPLALLMRLSGVPRISGISDDYPGSLLDLRYPAQGEIPEAERALALAEAAGYPLPAGDDGRLRVKKPLPDVANLVGPPGYIIVHPGASVPARSCPPANAAAAVRALAEAGHRVVVSGPPDEASLTSYVSGGCGLDIGGRTDLRELAAVCAGAAAVVVGNTGPAHLAAAVGTPVVSLFAPTVPAQRWAPYKVPTVLLGDQNAPCAGTRARQCPIPGHPCLANVEPAQVVAAVDELVGVRT